MLDSARWRIVILARNCGFYAKTIQRMVKRYDGEQWSTGTIYKVLKEEGVKLRDYRDGKTPEAKRRVRDLGADSKPPKGKK